MSGERSPLTILIGSIVLAAGTLIALLSGGCTLLFGGWIISDALHGRGGSGAVGQAVIMVLALGGVPFAVGAVAAWAGWRMIRGPKQRPADQKIVD
jgi:hypothetical protein